eukprot:GHVP01043780.1.p1 GENE.GHVP01043780.1~~GHVP01043780.1.p1  ORF type:complete len:395 (+),score=16.63 GHVP01043780.1:1279-2463(+)
MKCTSCPYKPNCKSSNSTSIESSIKLSINTTKVICIMSGKGGIGKSTISSYLSTYLSSIHNKSILLIDLDTTTPSIPVIFDIHTSNPFITYSNNLHLMNGCLFNTTSFHVLASRTGDMTGKTDDIAGKTDDMTGKTHDMTGRTDNMTGDSTNVKTNSSTNDFTNDLANDFTNDQSNRLYDYVIIDTPPGTTSTHIDMFNRIPSINVILIGNNNQMCISDIERQIDFCNRGNKHIIGIIENMSNIICDRCFNRNGIGVDRNDIDKDTDKPDKSDMSTDTPDNYHISNMSTDKSYRNHISNMNADKYKGNKPRTIRIKSQLSIGSIKSICERDGMRYIGKIPINKEIAKHCDKGEIGINNDFLNSDSFRYIKDVLDNISNSIGEDKQRQVKTSKDK